MNLETPAWPRGLWRIPVGDEIVLLVLVAEGDLYISGIIPRLWLL
jgi:hypothetical protein